MQKTLAQTDNSEKTTFQRPLWFPLDIAATIYPAARNRTWRNNYRFAVVLKEDIDPVVLQKAADDLFDRFPMFFVKLKTGLFWNYFKSIKRNTLVVREETEYPCRPMKIYNTDEPPFRVLYYKRRISIEVFHALCDGGSALNMMNALAYHYMELKGYDVENNGELININDTPSPEEYEDCFLREYVKDPPKSPEVNEVSYQYKPERLENYFKVIHGIVPVADLKTECKKLNITITDYLLTAFLLAIYRATPARNDKKPIKVSVPISLRNIFGSNTMRNFAMYTNIGFVPTGDEHTFESVRKEIDGKLKEYISRDAMLAMVCGNVKMAKNPFVRFMPFAIKRQVMKFGYKLGSNKFTDAMTNLGISKLPPSMAEHVDRVEVMIGGGPTKQVCCAMLSDKDVLNITFTGATKSVEIQREFFRILSSQGVRVRIECNCVGEADRI